MELSKEIKQNWIGLGSFEIYLCVIFDWYYEKFISRRETGIFFFLFFSFYHNKIYPVTNYKAIKNKINKTKQHKTKNTVLTNKTTTTKKANKKKNEMKLLALAPFSFHFERNVNQSYDQKDVTSLITYVC